MPEQEFIKDLLHRRSDMSSFVLHFTRGTQLECEYHILSMLKTLTLIAEKPFGMAKHLDALTESTSVSQRSVCFTDMPIEHSWMMVRKIAGRLCEFQPYGLVFSKEFARNRGCHPVWYVDAIGPDPSLSTAAFRLIELYRNAHLKDPATFPLELLDIFRLTPFMEVRGSAVDFMWEREWRHRGDFTFQSPANVVAVLAPENKHPDMRGKILALGTEWVARDVPILDPSWGTDKIIHTLSHRT